MITITDKSKVFCGFLSFMFFSLVTMTDGTSVGPPSNNCTSTSFRCEHEEKRCVALSWLCDGDYDCQDGSDEQNCPNCNEFERQCSDGCIALGWVCDGDTDCLDGSDEDMALCAVEDHCKYFGAPCLSQPNICVNYSRLCDGKVDCPQDRSDEGQLCKELYHAYNGRSLCDEMKCEYACTILPTDTATCYCQDGFTLSSHDNRTCVESDVCSILDLCEQICTPHKNSWSYSCACEEDFLIHPEYTNRCILSSNMLDEPYIIVTSERTIQKLDIDGRPMSATSNAKGALALDYNWPTNQVCWVEFPQNPALSQLICGNLNNMNTTSHLTLSRSMRYVQQLAFDWITGNIYFVDSAFDNIFVCNPYKKPSICITVSQQPATSNLFGLAVDPLSGLLFFTDHGKYPKLMRMEMNGENETPIVTQKIVFPQTVTLDTIGKRVYFIDAHIGYVASVDYNGRHRREISSTVSRRQLLGSFYFNNSFYVSDWQNGSVIKMDGWNSLQPAVELYSKLRHPRALRLVHPLMQKPDPNNGCAKLGCKHICLLGAGINASTTGTCFCSPGYILSSDGISCEGPSGGDLFLLYSKEYPGEIKGTSLLPATKNQTTSFFIPIENLQSPKAFDFYRNQSDKEDWVIFCEVSEYDATSEAHSSRSVHNCRGLAVDWTSSNVYWTDDGYKTISVTNLTHLEVTNNLTRPASYPNIYRFEPAKHPAKTLIRESILRPRSIVLHPARRLMFWTAMQPSGGHGSGNGAIKRAWMDGSNSSIVVSGSTVKWPNGLTIDRKRNMLFWVEDYYDTIECIHINGTNRKFLVSNYFSGHTNYVSSPFSISFYDSGPDLSGKESSVRYLYWSEYRTGYIYRLNVDLVLTANSTFPRAAIDTIVKADSQLLNVLVFNPSMQIGSSACSNTLCSDFCVPIPSPPLYRCLCADHRKLNGDGLTCSDKVNYTSAAFCPPDHFECRNGRCIVKKWLCDRDDDCGDDSDESPSLCGNINCTGDRFQCKLSGTCISSRWVCDHEEDCVDGEDEAPATCTNHSCAANHFACKNGPCIPDTWVCDTDEDCLDGSDESNNCSYTTCNTGVEFTCRNGKCISLEWRCDNDYDCSDHSDEVGCGPTVSTPAVRCTNPYEVPCGNSTSNGGRCIPSAWTCDGDTDCPDGSDEENCNVPTCLPSQRPCASGGKCIYSSWWCDGDAECDDRSDETDCGCPTLPSNQYKQIRCLKLSNYMYECVNRCDGVFDCVRDEDERHCSSHGTCDDAYCSHTCKESNLGFICSCPKGKELSEDMRTCRDIDYCSERGLCGQNCTLQLSSYRCSCYDGWHVDRDYPSRSMCAYDKPNPPPFIIFSSRHSLKYMVMDTGPVINNYKRNAELLIGGLNHVLVLDFHYSRNLLFYTDVLDDTVSRATVTYNQEAQTLHLTDAQPIISQGLATPEGIAVDWLANRIYFVDATLNHIEAADLNGLNRTVIVAGDVESPRAISVDPRFGLMFWTDWEVNNARVERATMAGTDRMVLWDSGNNGTGWPNGLTLDYMEERIYWSDAKFDAIWSCKYDGSDRFTAVWRASWLSHPFGITTYAHRLIWTDWRTTVIATSDKWPGRNVSVVELAYVQPFDVKVFHESRQPATTVHSRTEIRNPCKESPCDGLCLLVPGSSPRSLSYKCTCPHMYTLDDDGRSCHLTKSFMLYSQSSVVRGLRLDDLNYSSSYAMSAPILSNVTRLAYHASREQIYWFDAKRQEIRRSSVNGSSAESVIKTDSPHTYGLAIDWLRDLVFWTSYSEQSMFSCHVNVMSLDKRYKYRLESTNHTLPWNDIHHPRDVTIDVARALLYFASDEGIFSVRMDGSQLELVSALNVTDLQFHEGKLYFINNDSSVCTLHLDGCADACLDCLGPTATLFAINEDMLWLYNLTTSSIYSATKNSPNGEWQLKPRITKPNLTDMIIYDPAEQNSSLSDTRPCLVNNGGCDQLCLPIAGDSLVKMCKCTIGYQTKEHNASACEGIGHFLIYSGQHSILGIHLNGEEDALVPIKDQSSPTGVDFYAKNDTIIWIDAGTSSIKATTRDMTSQWNIYSPYGSGEQSFGLRLNSEQYEGVAVDWIAKNIYWTDSGLDQIKVVRLDGLYAYTVHQFGEKFRAIAVHPVEGFVFVSDWGSEASIHRMRMDGSEAHPILTGLGWPNGLTLDYKKNLLYWCDARTDTIQSSNLDGRARREILESGQSRTYGLTFYNSWLYWTDSHDKGGSIAGCNATNCSESLTILGKGLSQWVKDIAVYSSKRQIGSNLCGVNNGGCEELCFYIGTNQRRCACAHGILDPKDNTSCRPFDRYVMYSERTALHSINVDDPKDLNEPLPPIESAMKSVVVMASDYEGNRIFYSDMLQGNIYDFQTLYNGRNIPAPRLVVEGVRTVEGLAYHRASNSLFWTSYHKQSILKHSLLHPVGVEPPQVVVKCQSKSDRLRALVLYECESPNLMFWTNWNEEDPAILRSNITGGQITKIITTMVVTPNGLAVDAVVKQLYWADAALDKIERCDFYGTNRVIIISEGLHHVFSLAVLGKYLYWSDWRRDEILRVNKWTGVNPEMLRNYNHMHPMGILAVYNDTCIANPCIGVTCEHKCVVSESGGAMCMCPNGTISTHCSGAELECGTDHFTCNTSFSSTNDSICVRYEVTCDQVVHCPNGEDEDPQYCNGRTCREGYWMCGNNRCIRSDLVCDQTDDCTDGSDEVNCSGNKAKCVNGMFTCDNGNCIPKGWNCDRENDCGDNSDEKCNQSCPMGTFHCASNNMCIPASYKCDSEEDCPDGSDEKSCDDKGCRDTFFVCVSNGQCVPIRWTCDGENDCQDGSDEKSCDTALVCEENQFRCTESGKCIDQEWRCDREEDCQDGSDEIECDYPPCNSTHFRCSNNQPCLPHDWVCDGDADCVDGADEANCTDESQSCNFTTHLQCSNGECLPLSKACDGKFDCKGEDKTDERNCNHTECVSRELHNCDQICVDRLFRYSCACRNGYRLGADLHTCSDVNECTDENPYPPCSQRCENQLGSYACSCASGYYKDRYDSSNCKAGSHTGPAVIVFANKYYLRETSLDGSALKLRISHLRHSVAIDFDWPGQKLYWTDITSERSVIQRMDLNQSFDSNITTDWHLDLEGVDTIHRASIREAHGLAVDWVARNLYWSDKGLDTIEVSKLDGRYRKTLIDSDLDQPRALALDPRLGYLYWSDWGSDPHIGRIGMDGTDRTVIMHNRLLENQTNRFPGKKLGWPNAITIDYASRKLFWADGKEDYIAHCNMDGSNPRILLQRTQGQMLVAHVFSMTLFEDRLYWTDWSDKSIHSVHKFRGKTENVKTMILKSLLHRPMDLKVVHPLRQPLPVFPHQCVINNGDCQDLCLISPRGGYRCDCPNNFYLAEDRRTCISNCSYSEFVCKTDKCIPSWWKCDGVDDCGDMSDEPDNCGVFHCRPGQFQCANSTAISFSCISPSGLCDGQKECSDGSDERNCYKHVCLSSQFKCNRSNPPRCIPEFLRCDGTSQCDQNEDESDCATETCSSDEFPCGTGSVTDSNHRSPVSPACLPKIWLCDGDEDCSDGSDEHNCNWAACKLSEFRCLSDGQCLSSKWVCDRESDCKDGSDENEDQCNNRSCGSTEFKCKNHRCIPKRWQCDLDNDCGDRSDEANCSKSALWNCTDDEFRCSSDRPCIRNLFRCDGELDCADGSDELNCTVIKCNENQFRCDSPAHCIPMEFRCDGAADCFNGTDELNCKGFNSSLPLCPSYMHTCLDGACIPMHWLCDGQFDCPDGSDEGPVCINFRCTTIRPYRCKNHNICIPFNKLCNGQNDCFDDTDDETAELCRYIDINYGHTSNSSHCMLWKKQPAYSYPYPSNIAPNDGLTQGYLCMDRSCTPFTTLCDGTSNCASEEDETVCLKDLCSSVSNPCRHIPGSVCLELPKVARGGLYHSYCSCKAGMQLKSFSGHMGCTDVDECAALSPCSQTCHNTQGGFHCTCANGWIKSDITFCKTDPSKERFPREPTLVVVSGIPPSMHEYKSIEAYPYYQKQASLGKLSNQVSVDRIAVSPFGEDTIFWIDAKHRHIYKYEQDVTSIVLSFPPISRLTGIAWDWVGSNLYWTDAGTGSVSIMQVTNYESTDRRRRRSANSAKFSVLLNSNNSALMWPLDIALDVETGDMFVSDGGNNITRPSIHRFYGMAPNSGRRIVSTECVWPVSLAIDRQARRIYWADSKLKIIASVNYDGSNRQLVRRFEDKRPQTIKVYGDFVFGTTFRTNGIFRIHKLAHVLPSEPRGIPLMGYRLGTIPDDEITRNKIVWLVHSSSAPQALAIFGTELSEDVKLRLTWAPMQCSWCQNHDSKGFCVVVEARKYGCMCPFNSAGVYSLRGCPCGGFNCSKNQICRNGRCVCRIAEGCEDESNNSVSGTTSSGGTNLALVVGLVALFLGVFVITSLICLARYKRRRKTSSQNNALSINYRELVANEAEVHVSLTSPTTAMSDDVSGDRYVGDEESTTSDGEETATARNIEKFIVRNHSFHSGGDETTGERVQLLLSDHLTLVADSCDENSVGASQKPVFETESL